MQENTDRRRHKRFEAGEVAARVALIHCGAPALELAPCTLVNVSYGGMCVRVDAPLEKSADYHFLIDLGAPFGDLVLVKARILWTGAGDAGCCQAGAEFLESSKGWLGPDEDGDE